MVHAFASAMSVVKPHVATSATPPPTEESLALVYLHGRCSAPHSPLMHVCGHEYPLHEVQIHADQTGAMGSDTLCKAASTKDVSFGAEPCRTLTSLTVRPLPPSASSTAKSRRAQNCAATQSVAAASSAEPRIEPKLCQSSKHA